MCVRFLSRLSSGELGTIRGSYRASAESTLLCHLAIMASSVDQDLSRWQIYYGIGDDAFTSLQNIFSRSGRNNTGPDNSNNVIYVDSDQITDATPLS